MARFRIALALVAVLLLAVAATAGAEKLKPGSLRLDPNRPSSATALVVNADFDQPAGAQLQAYNVDIGRGFRFDPRAVAARCTIAQAHSSTCPAASRIGSGQARVTIGGPGAPSGPVTFLVDFYVTPPQQRGDIAGLVLAVHQSTPGVGFSLVGRLVRLKHGPFGLELRFTDTAKELPSGVTVQLNHIHARIGAHRGSHDLLTTPRTCGGHGWPFRLVVAYSTGTEDYSGVGACRAG